MRMPDLSESNNFITPRAKFIAGPDREIKPHTQRNNFPFFPRPKINNNAAQAASLARVVSPVIGRYSGGRALIGREIN